RDGRLIEQQGRVGAVLRAVGAHPGEERVEPRGDGVDDGGGRHDSQPRCRDSRRGSATRLASASVDWADRPEGGRMPLSEQEQRLLDEMERHLLQNDADVVSAPSGDRALSYRNLVYGALLLLVGVGGLIAAVAAGA